MDFRKTKIIVAIKELGWSITEIDEVKEIITVNNCWFISLSNKKSVQFNIICLEYNLSDLAKADAYVNVLNSINKRIKLYAQNGIIVATSEIESISMLNDSFSMADCIRMINAEAMASAQSINKALNHS